MVSQSHQHGHTHCTHMRLGQGQTKYRCSHRDVRTFKAAIPDSVEYLGSQPRETISCTSQMWVWSNQDTVMHEAKIVVTLIDFMKKTVYNMSIWDFDVAKATPVWRCLYWLVFITEHTCHMFTAYHIFFPYNICSWQRSGVVIFTCEQSKALG